MNEEIDESEFYHQDFTTASEWEIFIANMEEIINQWKKEDLKNDLTTTDGWNVRNERLDFVDFKFTLTFYRKLIESDGEEKAKKHLFDNNYDFVLYDPRDETAATCLHLWYGIDEFIVLSPSNYVDITSETKIKILLSSACIAVRNTNSEVPIFVQIRKEWQKCYLGIYETEDVRTNLEMVHLKITPSYCRYVSGLLDLFKTKIMYPTTMLDILVSVQLTYVLQDFGSFTWAQSNDTENINHHILPFGVTSDPLKSLIFKTTFSQLRHRSVTDSESYSQFDPFHAHRWSLMVEKNNPPVCLLTQALTDFCSLQSNTFTILDVLGDFISSPAEVNNPLDVLTEPKVPIISSVLSRATRNSLSRNKPVGSAPLPEDILIDLFYYLFPDADNNSEYPYDGHKNTSKDLENECKGFKTCPEDTLVWRLVIVLTHIIQPPRGMWTFSHLWYEFVQELRYRWEKSIKIPGILPGAPDLRTCLLHQKLQMLNCCIDRRHQRESISSSNHFESAEESSTDDDEFYDCLEEDTKQRKSKYSIWNQPVGRLGKFENLKLLETGDPLYVPITQEPVPKSEDQLEEDMDVLMRLGSDAQGSELRAKMMSASLLSDMESFKAANPGSILEDFIRWYSPRDWIEEEDQYDEWGQKKGTLSSRMQIENNSWMETWKSAKPVPAHRQKRLFDDTREAEKVLHYLNTRTISQVADLLIPVLAHSVIYRLHDEIRQFPADFFDASDRLRALIRNVERLSRDPKLQPRYFENFTEEVKSLELLVSLFNSINYKLNPSGGAVDGLPEIVVKLLGGYEIVVEKESVIGNRLVVLFSLPPTVDDVKINFLIPIKREVVLRVKVPRPASYSIVSPQFLRAILEPDSFRLVAAFSEDTQFF